MNAQTTEATSCTSQGGMRLECQNQFINIMQEQVNNFAKMDKDLSVLRTELTGFIELYKERHKNLETGQTELKCLLVGEQGIYERMRLIEKTALDAAEHVKLEAFKVAEEVREKSDQRLTKLENRQLWLSGVATGAGFAIAKAWDWFTSGGGRHP